MRNGGIDGRWQFKWEKSKLKKSKISACSGRSTTDENYF
jgi:hypothetical protein